MLLHRPSGSTPRLRESLEGRSIAQALKIVAVRLRLQVAARRAGSMCGSNFTNVFGPGLAWQMLRTRLKWLPLTRLFSRLQRASIIQRLRGSNTGGCCAHRAGTAECTYCLSKRHTLQLTGWTGLILAHLRIHRSADPGACASGLPKCSVH